MALALPSGAAAADRPNPPNAPIPDTAAAITSPVAGAVVNGVVPIVGTANITTAPPYNFQFYKVEWGAGASPQSWNTISTTYPNPVANDVLDRWDTSTLPDGPYVIQLSVVDNTGNFRTASVPVIVKKGVAPVNPAPAPQPGPSSTGTSPILEGATAKIVSQTTYRDGNFFYIVGEIQNVGTAPAGSIVVLATFDDGAGKVVATSAGTSLVDVLVPGQKAPFGIQRFEDPALGPLSRYSLELSLVRADPPPPTGLAVFQDKMWVDQNLRPFVGPSGLAQHGPALRHVSGQVHNSSASPSGAVKLVAAFYDANGAVVRAGVGYPAAPSFSLSPGASQPFDLTVPDSPAIASYSVQTG